MNATTEATTQHTSEPEGFAKFYASYAECVLWLATEGDDAGTPVTETPDDLPDETRASLRADALAFFSECAEVWRAVGMSDDDAGHNFHLTRCGHGTGFWDRGLPEDVGERLSEASRAYHDESLYRGADGSLYHFTESRAAKARRTATPGA